MGEGAGIIKGISPISQRAMGKKKNLAGTGWSLGSRAIPAGSSARPRRLTRLPVSAIKKSHVCLPPLATTRPLVSTACQTRTRARGGAQTNRQTKIEKKATFLHYDFSGVSKSGWRTGVLFNPHGDPRLITIRPSPGGGGKVGGLDTHHMAARRHALSSHLLLKRRSPPSFLIPPSLALCIFFNA